MFRATSSWILNISSNKYSTTSVHLCFIFWSFSQYVFFYFLFFGIQLEIPCNLISPHPSSPFSFQPLSFISITILIFGWGSAKNRHCLLGVNDMRCLQHARTSISSMNDWRGLKVLKIFSPWCYLRLGRITIIVKSLCYSKDVRGAIWHRWREENKARWGFFLGEF